MRVIPYSNNLHASRGTALDTRPFHPYIVHHIPVVHYIPVVQNTRCAFIPPTTDHQSTTAVTHAWLRVVPIRVSPPAQQPATPPIDPHKRNDGPKPSNQLSGSAVHSARARNTSRCAVRYHHPSLSCQAPRRRRSVPSRAPQLRARPACALTAPIDARDHHEFSPDRTASTQLDKSQDKSEPGPRRASLDHVSPAHAPLSTPFHAILQRTHRLTSSREVWSARPLQTPFPCVKQRVPAGAAVRDPEESTA
jgi:hypothetical protein